MSIHNTLKKSPHLLFLLALLAAFFVTPAQAATVCKELSKSKDSKSKKKASDKKKKDKDA